MSIAFLNRTSQVGKRVRYVGLVSVVVVTGLLGAAALFIGKPRVSPQAIASSVTRAPELLERAWQLPVAATFNRELVWQSNISRCGPASVANAYRSLGDTANTEDRVLAGTGRCWTGFCILGLTLDELADVARANPQHKIAVLRDFSEEDFGSIFGTRMIPDAATSLTVPASDIFPRSAAILKPRIWCSSSTSTRTTNHG